MNILIVDDQPDLARILAKYLCSRGHPVACVSSGKTALNFIHDHPVSLIVLDWAMPEMSGLDVLRAVKADRLTADIPVVMYTAIDEAECQRQAAMAGASDYVVKCSVELKEFDAIIEQYIRKSPPGLP